MSDEAAIYSAPELSKRTEQGLASLAWGLERQIVKHEDKLRKLRALQSMLQVEVERRGMDYAEFLVRHKSMHTREGA